MKIKLFCIGLFVASICFCAEFTNAQKRNKARNTTAKTTSIKSLTQEQKDSLQLIIDKADSIERDFLSNPKDAVYTAESFITSNSITSGIGLPVLIRKQADRQK